MYPTVNTAYQDCRHEEFLRVSQGRMCIILIMIIIICPAATARSGGGILVTVTDDKTGSGLDGASLYIDGGYAGDTSAAGGAGTFRTGNLQQGSHTIRVSYPGYQTMTRKVLYPGESAVKFELAHSPLVSLNSENNNTRTISIVFIPSSTYFRTSDNSKISTDTYTGNETRFREDVTRVIKNTFDNLDQITDPAYPLMPDFRDRYTLYYYFDSNRPADAFSGCAGSIPADYWNTVTFSDLTIILYPDYQGWYTNASSQPVGCFMNSGTGHKQLKIPAVNRDFLILHETGHGLFGLVDTYCGDTDYFENDPFPNVWSTLDACRVGAMTDNRDPSGCRMIEQVLPDSDSCRKDFWRWDPDPDIMKTSGSGTFGRASTERIAYVLTRSGKG